ncbi:MAG TPA: hypothetical protein DEB31_09645 [Clostridiales bacterium]|nr:hypothetical protein [Clostridiales bacterium]
MFQAMKMPKLSEASDEYKIVRIRRGVGEQAKQGEVFLDVETDKGAMEVAFYLTGVITELNVREGDTVRYNAMLGVVDTPE